MIIYGQTVSQYEGEKENSLTLLIDSDVTAFHKDSESVPKSKIIARNFLQTTADLPPASVHFFQWPTDV